MSALALQSTSESKPAAKQQKSAPRQVPAHQTFLQSVSVGEGLIQRKSNCACGGGCPSCQASEGQLKVSKPNDAAEIEADVIADRVMRMPIGATPPSPTNRIDPTNA